MVDFPEPTDKTSPQDHPSPSLVQSGMRATFPSSSSSTRSRHSTPPSPSRDIDSSTPRPHEHILVQDSRKSRPHTPADPPEPPVIYDSASSSHLPSVLAQASTSGTTSREPIRSFGVAGELPVCLCHVCVHVCVRAPPFLRVYPSLPLVSHYPCSVLFCRVASGYFCSRKQNFHVAGLPYLACAQGCTPERLFRFFPRSFLYTFDFSRFSRTVRLIATFIISSCDQMWYLSAAWSAKSGV